jgi:ferredoxin
MVHTAMPPKATKQTLRVNPIDCTGHGVCAELLPELISVDEWGYPIVDPRPVPSTLERDARRAVAACPALALKLLRAGDAKRWSVSSDRASDS